MSDEDDLTSANGGSAPSITVSATATALNARTGGRVGGSEPTILSEHAEWSGRTHRAEIISHRLARRFEEALEHVPLWKGDAIRATRGFNHLPEGQPPGELDVGPPPPDKVSSGGRYNAPRESVLYLCDSDQGSVRELQGHGRRTGPIWLQPYRVPVRGLRIANVASLDTNNVVNQAFWHAELGTPYVFSQWLAEVIRPHFDGMIVRGTRGDRLFCYCNVVVFAHERWQDWLDGEPRLVTQ